jgi:hypothetical protein
MSTQSTARRPRLRLWGAQPPGGFTDTFTSRFGDTQRPVAESAAMRG